MPDATQQEELARLFSHNLTLTQPPPEFSPVVQQQQQQQAEKQAPALHQPITYISQHYTHSWHAVPKSAPASVTSYTESVDSELEAVLHRNSIDPSTLFPSQISLFRNADDDQRLRLLKLWRISPPCYGDRKLAEELGNWPETTLQQEERMAQLRYERLMRERVSKMEDDEMATESAALEAPSMLGSGSLEDPARHAEPYILSGYEMLAKREYEEQTLQDSRRHNQTASPVYHSTRAGMWTKTDLQDMENNYGAFAQMRESGHFAQPPAVHELDHDMVM